MEILLLIPPALGAVAFAVFYFMKSSKEMPKNMKELWIELQVQHSGTQGLIEDLLFRARNKVGKCFYKFVYFYTSMSVMYKSLNILNNYSINLQNCINSHTKMLS